MSGHDHSWAEEPAELYALCPDYNPQLAALGITCPGQPDSHSERNTMGPQEFDLTRYSTDELREMHLDYYRRGLAHFEEADRQLSIMAGLDYPSAAYDVAKVNMRHAMAAGTATHELVREIGRTLDARTVNADA